MSIKDVFGSYLSDARWQIYAGEWAPELQAVREAQFTLGNGFVGSRGILEEIPRGSSPGTYFAAVFDRLGAQVPEMVNAPNPIDLRITVGGEKLDVSAMEVLDHRQILDMRRAAVARRTVYANAAQQRIYYESLRFFSLPNPNLAAMKISLTAMEHPQSLTVMSTVNTGVFNKGFITEGDKRHFNITEVQKSGDANYLCVETMESHTLLAYASLLEVSQGNRIYYEPHRTFQLKLKAGETVGFTKYVAFHTSRQTPPARLRSVTVGNAVQAGRAGFDKLYDEHSRAWAKRWDRTDVRIIGDPDAERALRFNIYHLMLMVNEEDADFSPGARGLTGEGYRGHVFWDTEIFMFPFYVFNFPRAARNMLMYRYRRLQPARENAKIHGYLGAMFPWESADSGEETTPAWHKDLDGTIKQITTGSYEHHITADIAYAIHQYWLATGDDAFMVRHGLEMMIECARFWTSRVVHNPRKGYYEIPNVTGPDEFHEDIHNNAFTNAMAKWNLAASSWHLRHWRSERPAAVKRLADRLMLKTGEEEQWERIALQVVVPRKHDLIEAFSGFFRLKHLPLPEVDDYFIPKMPSMAARDLQKTQYVKQADVVMLLYLLQEQFSHEELKQNYYYYEERTIHKSSLSPAIYGSVGAWLGDLVKARRYLVASLYTDLRNVHGNTQEGIHTASLGGTWQTMIRGFADVRLAEQEIVLNPRLPSGWKGMMFSLMWKGGTLWVTIEQGQIKLQWTPGPQKEITVQIHGVRRQVAAEKENVFPYVKARWMKPVPPSGPTA